MLRLTTRFQLLDATLELLLLLLLRNLLVVQLCSECMDAVVLCAHICAVVF